MQTLILIILLTITSSTIAETYGPTKTGDLLWNIAGKVRPNKSITRYQAMLALLKANPHAFRIPCNLNSLKIGKILQIPTNMQELTAREAVNEFYRQNSEWKKSRKHKIVCQPTEKLSIVTQPVVADIEPIITSYVDEEIEIAPPENFATYESEKINFKQQPEVSTSPISQVLITDNSLNETENLTMFESVWNDTKTLFYSFSYLHQILFLALIILLSISLLLLLFASIFRSKKTPVQEEVVEEEKTMTEETINTQFSSPRSDNMKIKLDTVRSYLAEDEDNRIQKLLRDVIQNGSEEQKLEAQQLYEINKKMSYLKLTDTQSINTNVYNMDKINKLVSNDLPLPKDREQVFSLIDEVFMRLDEELNTQGKLIDSYIARQQEIVNSNVTNYENSYQVVEENDSSKRPELKPTRRL